MKIFTKIVVISLFCSAVCTNAKASTIFDKVYLKAGVGVGKYNKFKATTSGYINKSPKTGAVYSAGVGYKFTDAIRSDLYLQHGKIRYRNGSDRQNIKNTSVFLNGYYDINLSKKIIPYITAGIGIGRNKANDFSVLTIGELGTTTITLKGRARTNFIWNIGLGIKHNFNNHFALELGHRYMNLGKSKTDDDVNNEIYAGKQKLRRHQFMASLIYSF